MKTCLLIQHGNTLKRHVFESSSLLLLFSPVKSFTGIFSLYAKTASPIENKIKPSSEMCFTFFGINSRPFPAPFLSKVFPNYEQKENRHLSAYKKLELLLTLLVFNVSLLSHWNVVITYISCFHKMLVRGLVTMVLYSSGRTDKWKEERNFPINSKEMEYGHFHLQNPLSGSTDISVPSSAVRKHLGTTLSSYYFLFQWRYY